jgi:hypothetical protein
MSWGGLLKPEILRAARWGATLERPLFVLSQHSDEGAEILASFIHIQKRARWEPVKQNLEAFELAAERLKTLARKNLHGDELKAFEGEISQSRKVIASRASSQGVPMPESARYRSIYSDATRVTLSLKTAQYEGLFLDHMSRLMRTGATDQAEDLAITTFRRLQEAIGNETENGWSRVFEYCARHASKISPAASRLRDVQAKVAQLGTSSPALRGELLRATQRFGGYLYPIRGELGEIYLHHWEGWTLQRSALLEVASHDAAKLPGKWGLQPFSGGAWIDGKKAWDEGILLIKDPTLADQQLRGALHTAAQMKVAQAVYAMQQSINDRLREIGKKTGAPELTIVLHGQRRKIILEALPPDKAVTRYVFYARGGHLPSIDDVKLKAANLQVTAMPVDISIDGFDAVARQVAFVARDFVALFGK